MGKGNTTRGRLSVSRLVKNNTIANLRKMCRQRKIPYGGLPKKKIAENIVAVYSGKVPPHKPPKHNSEVDKHRDRRLTPQVKHFCFAYAMDTTGKSCAAWAKNFGVNPATISKWLQWDQVKALVDKFITDREARLQQLFEKYEEVALLELINIIRGKKSTEVKRKAIVDFLGYAGRPNVNAAKMVVNQSQAQQAGAFAGMSNDDIDAELEELQDLIDEDVDG